MGSRLSLWGIQLKVKGLGFGVPVDRRILGDREHPPRDRQENK